MTLDPVTTPEEALAVALIRNECRQWMTVDTKVIDVERQLEFFHRLQRSDSMRLFIVRLNKTPIGYGIVRVSGAGACLTGGLAVPYRGKGLGRCLFIKLLDYAKRRFLKPWLTVLRTNRRAIRIYREIGFRTVRKTRRILTMEYDPVA